MAAKELPTIKVKVRQGFVVFQRIGNQPHRAGAIVTLTETEYNTQKWKCERLDGKDKIGKKSAEELREEADALTKAADNLDAEDTDEDDDEDDEDEDESDDEDEDEDDDSDDDEDDEDDADDDEDDDEDDEEDEGEGDDVKKKDAGDLVQNKAIEKAPAKKAAAKKAPARKPAKKK